MSAELQRLRAAVRQAQAELQSHLEAVYPVGMQVGVRLKHGQKNPTLGVVYSHWRDGSIQVHFPSARKPYRHINPDDVMETA